MAIKRRQFLQQSAALLAAPLLGTGTAWAVANRALFLSAFSDRQDQHFVAVLDEAGVLLHRFKAPSRGHSACLSRDGRYAVFFARRPGRWMMAVDLAAGQIRSPVAAASGRHFFGHGVCSADGDLLYVTENDYQNRRGVIGVYETGQLRRIREMGSFGIEPHELALLSDGNTLVVANGGIETHPDFERRKLNLPSMAPNLAYIDARSGRLLERVVPPHHQLSLRHLAVTPDDTVIVGAQYQGAETDDHPLVFARKKGGKLLPLTGQPLASQRSLTQYIASVTQCGDGKFALTSAPRGGRVSLWDVGQQSWIKDFNLPDIGGIAAAADGKSLLLTSGNGAIYSMAIGQWEPELLARRENSHWDNHLSAISPPA